MSCHEIGGAAAYIIEEVLKEFDKSKIDLETANHLVNRCIKSVHCCDGNEYEAYENIETCRCGRCLKETKDLKSLEDLDYKEYREVVSNIIDNLYVTMPFLCNECYEKVMGKGKVIKR